MLGYIFHQNMRKLSTTGYLTRGIKWSNAFRNIGTAIGPSHYLIAGLTELFGQPISLTHRVPALLKNLDQGLKDAAVIVPVCKNSGEYIGIAYNPNYFSIEHAGSVWRLSNPTSRAKVKCFNVPKNKIVKSIIGLPPSGFGTSANYRGLAYVAGDIGGQRYIFGFIHSDLSNDPYGSFKRMGEGAGDAIKSAIGATYNNAFVILGGDFNVPAKSVGNLDMYCELDKNGKHVPTSKSGKYTWDFWLVDKNTSALQARVHGQTLSDNQLSDHKGITLDI